MIWVNLSKRSLSGSICAPMNSHGKLHFGHFFFLVCFNCALTAIYHSFSCSRLYPASCWKEHRLYLYGCKTQEKVLENNRYWRKAGTYMNAHLRWSSQIRPFSYREIDCTSLPCYWIQVKYTGRERLLHKTCSNWWSLWKAWRKGRRKAGQGKRQAQQVTQGRLMPSVPFFFFVL